MFVVVMFVVVIYKYVSNRGIYNSSYLIYDWCELGLYAVLMLRATRSIDSLLGVMH